MSDDTYVVPTCPLHNYTGPRSIHPKVGTCKSCNEVDILYAVASSDSGRSYERTHMLEAIVNHWKEGIESGKLKTVDDLCGAFGLEDALGNKFKIN